MNNRFVISFFLVIVPVKPCGSYNQDPKGKLKCNVISTYHIFQQHCIDWRKDKPFRDNSYDYYKYEEIRKRTEKMCIYLAFGRYHQEPKGKLQWNLSSADYLLEQNCIEFTTDNDFETNWRSYIWLLQSINWKIAM